MANDLYGSCPTCGMQFPPPSSAGHQCVGRIAFSTTATAGMPLPIMNPLSEFALNAFAENQRLIAQIKRLTQERDDAKDEISRCTECHRHIHFEDARCEDCHPRYVTSLESRLSLLVKAAKEYMDRHEPACDDSCASARVLVDAMGDKE